MNPRPTVEAVESAQTRLTEALVRTPLVRDDELSEEFDAEIFLKREDLQVTRSYKARGALNRMQRESPDGLQRGVVCASAGNHAQGVAWAARRLGVAAEVFMPRTTSRQKIERVHALGGENATIRLVGDNVNESLQEARQSAVRHGSLFIHPFDDPWVIEGQATIGVEVLQDSPDPVDFIFLPVGGGGLASGVSSYVRAVSPDTSIVGVEPAGARSMAHAFDHEAPTDLPELDGFADGAAVERVGELTYALCRELLTHLTSVPEGLLCAIMLRLFSEQGIVVEPAGVLSVAGLHQMRDQVRGHRVVCLISGGNHDFRRTEEVRERALLFQGRMHYFVVKLPQRAGALRSFVDDVLGPKDDITHFQYSKRTARERGPAVVGIEISDPTEAEGLVRRIEEGGYLGHYLNDHPDLLQHLV